MAPLADVPVADPRWSAPGGPPPAGPPGAPGWPLTPPRLPLGYRWIAVRPGAAPPARRGPRLRGPTPRYAVIPRWGLSDRVEQPPVPAKASTHTGPSSATVRTTLFVSVLVLSIAALVYVVRYVLLVINRNTLLNSLVAIAAELLSVLASLAAIAAAIASGVMLIRWLIARRAAVFSHYALPEQRSVQALWAGCLAPLANLLWAPVYVIELAILEEHHARLRWPILQWWIAWAFSYAVSIVAMLTSFATDAQGIANNTVMMVFAYLFAAAAVAAAARVFEGFERKPVERPVHRWVMVGPDRPDQLAPAAPASAGPVDASAGPVELKGQEPAA